MWILVIFLIFAVFNFGVIYYTSSRRKKAQSKVPKRRQYSFMKDTGPIDKDNIPYPPRIYSSALSYISGSILEPIDLTLLDECDPFCRFIEKYIDYVPPEWNIYVIQYNMKLVPPEFTSDKLRNLLYDMDYKRTKESIIDVINAIKSEICSSQKV